MSITDDPNTGKAPLVSIAIPSFNHEGYVKDCILSVINQKYENIELIVIDDGSSDGSIEEIRRLIPACDERFVRFEFRTRKNKGLTETLNEAIEWSKGKYFSAIASDDIIFPDKTLLLVKHLEKDVSLAGVFAGCQLIDKTGQVISTINPPVRYYTFDEIIMRKQTIIAPTQLLRLGCLKDIGGYPKGLYIEDWYMWLALTEKGFRLKVVDGVLAQYRQHDTNISKNIMKMFDGRKQVLKFFESHKKYSFSRAIIAVMAAIDLPSIQRLDAFKFLIEAVSHYPKIIFTRFFAGALLRLILSAQLRAYLRKIKSS